MIELHYRRRISLSMNRQDGSDLIQRCWVSQLVLVFLAQARGEAEHELHALHFVHPIVQCGGQFFSVGGNDAGRAERAKLADGRGAITIDRAIASGGAPFVVFRQKYYDWNTIAAVNAKLRDEFTVSWPLDKTQINLSWIG